MTWACELTKDAERYLRSSPKGVQQRAARALRQLAGRVPPSHRAKQTVIVLRILIRSEKP